jgi:hypothetical protein
MVEPSPPMKCPTHLNGLNIKLDCIMAEFSGYNKKWKYVK